MKKIVFMSISLASILCAEVTSILPYTGLILYDNKSIKKLGTLLGVHATKGDLSYLSEIDISNINIQYRDKTVANLNQYDLTYVYSKYKKAYMYKVGYHYISTNDTQLGDGNLLITSFGGYTWQGYDKLSYGMYTYLSYFSSGQNEANDRTSVTLAQFTPYFTFYKAINLQWANTLSVRMNYEYAFNYIDKEYLSYEISDTIGYKSFFTTINVYGGEMRTGVKDSGMTIFNTLDVMKSGYGIQVGYYASKNMMLSFSFSQNNFREYEALQDSTNSVVVASFQYSY